MTGDSTSESLVPVSSHSPLSLLIFVIICHYSLERQPLPVQSLLFLTWNLDTSHRKDAFAHLCLINWCVWWKAWELMGLVELLRKCSYTQSSQGEGRASVDPPSTMRGRHWSVLVDDRGRMWMLTHGPATLPFSLPPLSFSDISRFPFLWQLVVHFKKQKAHQGSIVFY